MYRYVLMCVVLIEGHNHKIIFILWCLLYCVFVSLILFILSYIVYSLPISSTDTAYRVFSGGIMERILGG